MDRLDQARLIRELWGRLAKCQNERDAARREIAELKSKAKAKVKKRKAKG